MFTIYVSYRPQDKPMLVKEIIDCLANEFGASSILKDVWQKRDVAHTTSQDPIGAVQWALNQSDVLVVVIGHHWWQDAQGKPHMRDPKDPILQELGFASTRKGLPIIPVLIDGAKMPSHAQLGPAMQILSFKNPAVIRASDFDRDMAHLIDQLKKLASGQISGVRTFAEPDDTPENYSANALRNKNGIALLGLTVGTAIGLLIVAILLLQSVPQ